MKVADLIELTMTWTTRSLVSLQLYIVSSRESVHTVSNSYVYCGRGVLSARCDYVEHVLARHHVYEATGGGR
jgi:hypothetical protein